MKIVKVEDWEQSHINNLTLKLLLAATLATLAATALSLVLRASGFSEIRPDLLFAPWSVALVIGTAIAFHRGVLAERARGVKKEDDKTETAP